MILNFNELDYRKSRELLEVKEKNISTAEFYIEYLNEHALDIKESDINALSKKYSFEESFFKALKKKMYISDNDEEFEVINKNSKIDKIKCLDKSLFENNPYYKLISGINIKKDDWILNTQSYEAYEGFVYDELEIDEELFKEHTPLGFFKERFNYPAIIEKDLIWMSVIPHEINTMKTPIDNAYGNVLVLGLGLGYFIYMISLKKEVKKITVIEKDPKVIKIFKDYLIDKFEYKEKIEIINDDAFTYLDKLIHFDYMFSDIWHNVGDGFSLYLKLKNYENKNIANKYDYWIETSLLAMLRRYVLTIYEEKVIYKYTEEDYKLSKNENDKIINLLYNQLKDYQFNSYNEFHDYLKNESLMELARELKYN